MNYEWVLFRFVTQSVLVKNTFFFLKSNSSKTLISNCQYCLEYYHLIYGLENVNLNFMNGLDTTQHHLNFLPRVVVIIIYCIYYNDIMNHESSITDILDQLVI